MARQRRTGAASPSLPHISTGIVIPYRGHTLTTRSISSGVGGSAAASGPASIVPSSFTISSNPEGAHTISIRASTSVSFLNVCGTPRGKCTKLPAPAFTGPAFVMNVTVPDNT